MLFYDSLMPFRYYDFDLRQLVSFYEVARQRSYRRAADQLHIAQSAISRQIQSLENTLGSRLFERSYQRVTLTDAGRWMQKKLVAVFRAFDEIASNNFDKETPFLYWPLGTVVVTGPKVQDFYAEFCAYRATCLKADERKTRRRN
jgi:DNA-binding MarR family transcriptional regulator